MNLKALLTAALIPAAAILIAKEYTVGKYSVDLSPRSSYSISYDGNLILHAPVFVAHNAHWKWLFGGNFRPDFKAERSPGKIVITGTSRKPGVMENYVQTIILTEQGVTCKWSGTAKTAIHSINLNFELPEGIYGKKHFILELTNGKTISDGWSETIPEKPRWAFFHGIRKGYFAGENGVTVIEATPPNAYISDTRIVKRTYFGINVEYKLKAGESFSQEFKVSVTDKLPLQTPPKKKSGVKPTSGKTVKNSKELTNGKTGLVLDWKKGGVEKLILTPDDANLIRSVNPSDHAQIGFQWKNQDGTKFKGKIRGNDTLVRTSDDGKTPISEAITLKADESVFHFLAETENRSGREFSDSFQGKTSLIPGRAEREWNPQAFACFLKQGNLPECFRIVEQWGEIQRSDVDALALYDREMKSVFVLAFPETVPHNVRLAVGSQDSHAGRDRGKRTSLFWTFPAFKLPPGQSARCRYDFRLFKGLEGICGLRGNLAVNAQNNDGKCKISFAACGPVDETISVKIANQIIPFHVKLNALESIEKIIPISNTGNVPVEFSYANKMFAKCNIELKRDPGLSAKEKQLREETGKVFARLSYPGAETPESLTCQVKTFFHLDLTAGFLKYDEFDRAASEIQLAETELELLKKAVAKEIATPAVPNLRSMKDIKISKQIQAEGPKLYSPEGIRLFLQGMCDTDQFNHVNRIFMRIPDPLGQLDAKKDWKENLKNPRFRRLAIDLMVRNIRRYGNAHSQYFDTVQLKEPLYRNFMLEYFHELERQGVWLEIYISPTEWNMWTMPDEIDKYVKTIKDFMPRLNKLKNITHTVVVSPEPVVQIPRTNPNHWKEFRQWHAEKYGRYSLAKLGLKTDEALAKAVSDESTYSPVAMHYTLWLSGILEQATEKILQVQTSIGPVCPIYLGYACWATWPNTLTGIARKFMFDPRIQGFCVDNYLGGWWGTESNPPELAWTGDLQYSRAKPMIMGEWGSGAAMPSTSWKHAFESMRQSFGRNYWVRGVDGMFAWSASLFGWDNMFEPDGTPLPVTREFITDRDAIISNPVTEPSKVLLVSNLTGTPKFIGITQQRLAASLPLIGIAADTADYRDLETWPLSGYKMLIVHTEGIPAEVLTKLKKFPGKVFLLGRPSNIPDTGDASGWVKNSLFLKSKDVRTSGGGVSRAYRLRFRNRFGKMSGETAGKYFFAANRSAWITPEELLPDVEVLATAGKYPVLMKQGNLFWLTDMLGIGNLDMPVSRTVEFPAIQPLELDLLSNALREAGIPNQREPLFVKIVNDSAVSYDPHAGRVRFHHADAFSLPDGMFPRAYERFTDGIVLLTGGEKTMENNPVEIRCRTEKVKKVTLDGQMTSFRKLSPVRIAVDLKGKGFAVCDLRVFY